MRFIFIFLLAISASSNSADLKEGWNYETLVKDVDDCAIYLIKSDVASYKRQAIDPKSTEAEINKELMSFVRYMEIGYRAQCYCAHEKLYEQYSHAEVRSPGFGVDIGTLLYSQECIHQRDEAFELLKK